MSLIIVDYGLGNLNSVRNMILKLGEKCEISSDLDKINKASKLILPGVGSFDSGIKNLNKLDLFETINSRVLKERIPILPIRHRDSGSPSSSSSTLNSNGLKLKKIIRLAKIKLRLGQPVIGGPNYIAGPFLFQNSKISRGGR